MKVTPEETFKKTAEFFAHDPQAQPKQEHRQQSESRVDVAKYLDHYEKRFKEKRNGSGTLYCLETCLFDPSHVRESSIIQGADGVLWYQCFHASCKHTWQEARKLISGDDPLKPFIEGRKHSPSGDNGQYFTDEQGFLCRWKPTQNGDIPIRIANFTAAIKEEIIEDDGIEQRHRYVLKGKIRNRELPSIEVAASSFGAMNWLHKWGTEAILEPGQSNRDYLRHAIQVSSIDVKRLICYTHTGWREINGQWGFLTAGGGIGISDVSVRLSPELSRYNLPVTQENEQSSILASLSFLDIGNREVTLPLFAQTYLAPLTSLLDPMPNFSGYLYGSTGTFKTTLALLQLAHFGDFSTVANLPNFDDTANSLEKRASTLKDVIMVLDDYHPSQRRNEAMSKEAIAQRIIRAYSNRTARGRLNSDTTDKGRYSPRGFLQVTGEEIVSLPSTLARVFVVEIQPGDIDTQLLTTIQGKAHLLPYAMTSFILWIREHIDEIRETFPTRFRELRTESSRDGIHLKLPEQVAFFRFALETAIGWMLDKKAISESEADQLAATGWTTLSRLSKKHSDRISDDDPIKLFEDIIGALFTQGRIRLEHRNHPDQSRGEDKGSLIGYYDDSHVYMLPTPMWHEMSRFCIAEGSHFPFSKSTFYKMLRDRKMIEPGTDGRNLVTTWIQGRSAKILKFIGGCMSQIGVIGVIEENS